MLRVLEKPTEASGSELHAIEHPPVARLASAVPVTEKPIALTAPAMAVVTDFTAAPPVTVTEDCPIDDALVAMKRANVRSLLVVRGEQVVGLVTSSDIQGERPMRALQERGFSSHAEIEVGHVMSAWGSLPTLELDTVRDAQVRQVVEFFRHTPATHMLIVEYGERGGVVVRGLISRTRVERQVGFAIS